MKGSIYIPASRKAAEKHLQQALTESLESLPKGVFMKAYCSLAYLYPGFHPDGVEDWDGPEEVVSVAKEAWRRAEAGQLTDNELYSYQATKAAISQARKVALGQRRAAGNPRKRRILPARRSALLRANSCSQMRRTRQPC